MGPPFPARGGFRSACSTSPRSTMEESQEGIAGLCRRHRVRWAFRRPLWGCRSGRHAMLSATYRPVAVLRLFVGPSFPRAEQGPRTRGVSGAPTTGSSAEVPFRLQRRCLRAGVRGSVERLVGPQFPPDLSFSNSLRKTPVSRAVPQAGVSDRRSGSYRTCLRFASWGYGSGPDPEGERLGLSGPAVEACRWTDCCRGSAMVLLVGLLFPQNVSNIRWLNRLVLAAASFCPATGRFAAAERDGGNSVLWQPSPCSWGDNSRHGAIPPDPGPPFRTLGSRFPIPFGESSNRPDLSRFRCSWAYPLPEFSRSAGSWGCRSRSERGSYGWPCVSVRDDGGGGIRSVSGNPLCAAAVAGASRGAAIPYQVIGAIACFKLDCLRLRGG